MAPPTRTRRAAARRTLAPLAATALALLVVLGAATATPWRFRLPRFAVPEPAATAPAPAQRPGEILPGDQPPPSYDVVTWIVVALSVAGAVLVAVLLWLLARRFVRSLAAPEDDDGDDLTPGHATTATVAELPLPELQDAVATALARIDGAATPHDAVVAAWVALEDAAAEHGTRRDPAQTPTEFTARLLTGHRDDGRTVPAPDVDTLRRLYQHARFTDRPVHPDDVDAARAALSHIARALDPARHP